LPAPSTEASATSSFSASCVPHRDMVATVSVRIRVKTTSRLAAQVARLDHLAQQRRRSVLAVTEAGVEYLHHLQQGIQADQIRQCQRADRVVAAQAHAKID